MRGQTVSKVSSLEGKPIPLVGAKRESQNSLSQMGEMGDFCTSLARACLSASDLPRRASWSLTNFAFARLCWGV